MTRRNLIRIISFAIGLISVLIIRNCKLMWENKQNLQFVKNNYIHAVEELSTAADNISNTLKKELYSSSSDMHQKLSQQLWRDSSTAKAALAQLPMEKLELENTYKFLSQVGNYALSISKKIRNEEKITNEEYENLNSLYDFSKEFCSNMWDLEKQIESGEISIVSSNKINSNSPSVTDGFQDFEKGFDAYPTLIYDGPFSDHIMEKEPLMTKDEDEISEEKALSRCTLALNIDAGNIKKVTTEEGKMPSYVFSDDNNNITCAVTKKGGFVSYFIKNRDVNNSAINQDEAVEAADKFLEELGINSLKCTYYENSNGIMIINYAYQYNKVCCYTDLIKVSVAMDNGEILGYDARGYIVNHHQRNFKDSRISILKAQKNVSDKLTVKSRGLALIPSDSKDELLCYEFKCEAPDGTHVLVYINAYTGKEEQILMLFESENGVLTM